MADNKTVEFRPSRKSQRPLKIQAKRIITIMWE